MADSTINGLTALTGANVDNTADQLAIWDNSDSTTKKITRTELFSSVPSISVTTSMYVGNGSIEDPGTFVLDLSKTASSGNWRGFRDESSFTGTAGSQAYCNFDAAASLSGSYNYDHIVGFQSRPNHASSGTLTDLAGFSSIIRNNGGTVTNGWGFKVWDTTGSGTVTNQYGFYCNPLSKATNNWGVYIAGSTQSYFGGFVGMGSASVPDSLLHLEYPSTCNWKLKNSGSGVHVASYAGSSLGTVGTISNHDFFLFTNNSERLRVTSTDGLVQIAAAGTAALPAITFGGDTDTGIWNSAANQLTIATGGSSRVSVNNSQFVINASGSAATPSFANATHNSTGLFWTTATLGFSTGGAEAMRIDSAQRLLVGGSSGSSITDGAGVSFSPKIVSTASSGASGVLASVFDGTTHRRVGLFCDFANTIFGISTSGGGPFVIRDSTAERLRITTNGEVQIAAAGTAAAPAISFGGDTDTGIWNNAANELSIACNGSTQFRVRTTGIFITPNGTAAAPSVTNLNDSDTGMWWPTANTLGFSTGGTERLRLDSTGNVIVNTAAIAPTATDGFLYVSSCAGTPTGTPTPYSGRVPIVVDTTNNKLYFYSGGAWRDAGP